METSVYRIGNICSLKSGKRLPAGFDFSVEPTQYKYIRSRDIKAGKIYLDDVAFIDEEIKKRINKYIINTGDVAITIVANIGDIGYATPDCDGINLTENAVRLTGFDKSIVFSKYLSYYLSQPSMKQYMENLAAGAAQAKLGIYKIEKMKIQLPDVSIQKAVVDIIEKYDNLIEVNIRRTKVLEQMAENLYKEWFVRFRFPEHEKADFENGIPKGWRRGRISEFYTTSSGGTPSREHDEYYDAGTIPWIKTGELQDCLLIDTEEKITESAVKKSSAKFFPKNSVLMAMYGVNIGMLAYSTMDATCNQACCVFRDKGSINTKHYLFQCLKSIRDYLILISFGAAQQNLSQDLIKRVRIVMPDKETVIRFEQKIEPLYNETEHLLQANACLIRQRDLLLPRLMSGKLEV